MDDEYTDGTLLLTTASDALGLAFLLFSFCGWDFSVVAFQRSISFLFFLFAFALHCMAAFMADVG